jgi:hypothetical protein
VYDSVIVAAAGWGGADLSDLAGATLAINERDSWSGHHALRAHLLRRGLGQPLFGRMVVTGSHEASIDALIRGEADCASIDETVWDARVARDPRAAMLRPLDRNRSESGPALLDRARPRHRAQCRHRGCLAERDGLGACSIAPASDADYAVFRDSLAASRSLAWRSP